MRTFHQLALFASLTAASLSAMADEHKTGAIMVGEPWARVLLHNRPAAGFMMIHNMGDDADRVVAASSPMAERVELHTHIKDGNVMKMRPVEAIDVPAKGQAELKPGGLHLMIFGLKHPMKPGDMLPVTLKLEKAGAVEVKLKVDNKAGKHMQGDHSGHGSSGN